MKTRKHRHYEYHSSDHCLIQVGSDAKSNDELSLSISRPNEWWMHWEGGAGAHVIICSKDDHIHKTLPETLKDAATLALRHSKALPIDNKTYTVTLTRPSNVYKPKGFKDGMVQIMVDEVELNSWKSNLKKRHNYIRNRNKKMNDVPHHNDSPNSLNKFLFKYDDSRYQRLIESQYLQDIDIRKS